MGFFQFGSLFIFVGQKLTKMTKADIVKQLAQETGIEAATVSVVVEEFMEQVRGTVIAGEHVYLRGFGAFIRKHRREKTARNISKNVTIRIPAHDIPAFKTLSRLPAAFRKEMIATTPRFKIRIGALSFYRGRRLVRHSGAHSLRGTSPARCPSADV